MDVVRSACHSGYVRPRSLHYVCSRRSEGLPLMYARHCPDVRLALWQPVRAKAAQLAQLQLRELIFFGSERQCCDVIVDVRVGWLAAVVVVKGDVELFDAVSRTAVHTGAVTKSSLLSCAAAATEVNTSTLICLARDRTYWSVPARNV